MAQHERIRLDMQHRLLEIVQSKFPSSIKDNNKNNHSTVAKALDMMLYRAAPSLEDYSDLTTLEKRIRAVVTKKLQQKQHNMRKMKQQCPQQEQQQQQQQSQQAMKTTARRQILQEILKEDYETTQELVREIKLAKNRMVATFKCFGGVCVRQSPAWNEEFPKEIKALFFSTALVDAFDKTPLARLPTLDWKHLIQVAQSNLDSYKASPHCVP